MDINIQIQNLELYVFNCVFNIYIYYRLYRWRRCSFGPKSINKVGSLNYYIKRLGLNKNTDKLKYDILIRNEDLDTDCKIVGTWSKNTEIPQITGDIEG